MLLHRQIFTDARLGGGLRVVADLQLDRCQFLRSSLGYGDEELVIRDVVARRCVVKHANAFNVRFEDVLIEHLTTTRTDLAGCLFRHVTLRGPAGFLRVIGPVPAAVAFYRDVDWALDISEAEFVEGEFIHVPGELIRRDPETQFLLRREKVAGVDRTQLPSYASIAVSRFENTPFDTLVAVAPKRGKHFAERLAHLRELRDRGLAE